MAVGDHKALGGITANHRVIAADLHLLDGIDNFFPAIAVFVQIVKGSCPVIAAAEGKGFLRVRTIRQQLHGNAFRLDAVLIVVVFPNLPDRDTGLLRRVGVGDIETVIGWRVAIHSILGNGIGDFLPVLVLRQAGKAPLPAIVCGHSYSLIFQLCSIGIEPDGD